MHDIKYILPEKLRPKQAKAVRFAMRRVLVVADAGPALTEVMARRIAWWKGVRGIHKRNVVAFAFIERAANAKW